MRSRISLTALLAGLAATPVWAQTAELREGRDLQAIRAEARAPGSGPYVARLRGHDRTALERPAAVVDGVVRVEFLSSRRLLPGRYAVELIEPVGSDDPVLVWDLRYGDPQATEAALDRHRVWLQRAASTVRELSATLEQRATYTLARMQRRPDERPAELNTFDAFYRERWRPALLGARMDMQTYARRLLLPPLPEASEAIVALLDGLDARLAQWQRALESAGEPPALAPEVEAQRRRLLESLGLDLGGLEAWSAGPLATPPPWPATLDAARLHVDPLGFRLTVPEGFEPAETTRPEDRFRAVGPKQTTLLVQVMELPDARTAADLRAALEVANWESFLSYKRGEVVPLPDDAGLRITFRANASDLASAEQTASAVQVARFDPARHRIVSLIVFHPAGGEPAGLEQAEAGFRLEQP